MTRLLVGYPNVYMKKPEKVGPVKIFAVRRQDFSSCLLNVYVFFDKSHLPNTHSCWKNFDLLLVGEVEREIQSAMKCFCGFIRSFNIF